jgi:hypothetical protein
MNRLILPVLGLLCGLSATVVAANKIDASTPAAGPGKFIVHEWGTFTGLVGSDGGNLPFRSGVGSDLPSFVFTRAEQADRDHPGTNWLALERFTKDETAALLRMETPVVYFYTDTPRDVEARVEFPQGMLTEFYPPVRSMTPAYDIKDGREVLKGTSLDWGKIHLVPQATSANYPKVEGSSHYIHARATDAATVQFSDRPGELHEENFLFYRGLGDFSLRVTVTAQGKDHFTLHNSSGGPITTAFLIRSTGDGKTRFSIQRDLANGRQETMTLPSQESSVSELVDAVAKALVAEGLYEKEARAMVKTWEDNWFGEAGTGTRVLYMLPGQATDTLLPLQIKPTPDAMVRVLVGRIDVLTPEQENRIAGMFRKAAMQEPLGIAEVREVRALGRFQRPALDRVAQLQAWDLMRAVQVAEQTQNPANGG